MRCFCGCGSAWLPSLPNGAQYVDVELWKPCQKGFNFPGGSVQYFICRLLSVWTEFLFMYFTVDSLLPVTPDLRSIRELSVSPYLRSQMQVTFLFFKKPRLFCYFTQSIETLHEGGSCGLREIAVEYSRSRHPRERHSAVMDSSPLRFFNKSQNSEGRLRPACMPLAR